MSTITIKIPEYLRSQVEELSSAEGLSIDRFFATAASEKLSVIRSWIMLVKKQPKQTTSTLKP